MARIKGEGESTPYYPPVTEFTLGKQFAEFQDLLGSPYTQEAAELIRQKSAELGTNRLIFNQSEKRNI